MSFIRYPVIKFVGIEILKIEWAKVIVNLGIQTVKSPKTMKFIVEPFTTIADLFVLIVKGSHSSKNSVSLQLPSLASRKNILTSLLHFTLINSTIRESFSPKLLFNTFLLLTTLFYAFDIKIINSKNFLIRFAFCSTHC